MEDLSVLPEASVLLPQIPLTLDPNQYDMQFLNKPERTEVVNSLSDILQQTLYVEDKITVDKKFIDYGLDSITAVEFVKGINKAFNTNLSATDLYDHPTTSRLADFILKHLSGKSVSVQDLVVSKLEKKDSAVAQDTVIRLTDIEVGHDDRVGYLVKGVQDISSTVLQKVQVSDPQEGEVQIKVMASSINFPDIMCVKGLYPTMPSYPFVPGFEVSGVVVKTGPGVLDVSVGDEVLALTGTQMGGHCSYANVSVKLLVHKPVVLTFEEACSLPIIFLTTYYALLQARVKEKESILVQTAAGGCGLMAIQLANLAGAIPCGTSSRRRKLEFLKNIGLDYVGNYGSSDFEQEMRELTGNKGFDIVLNMLSGNMIQTGINLLGSGGRYIELAVHALKTSSKLDLSALTDNQEIKSIDLRRLHLSGNIGAGSFNTKDALNTMVDLIDRGLLHPVVSRIYPLSAINEAMTYVETGAHIGKVVVSHTIDKAIDLTDALEQRLKSQKGSALKNKQLFTDSIVVNKEPLTEVKVAETVTAKINTQDIAIIGMSARMPAAANVNEFWDNLKTGKNTVVEVPEDRWPQASYFDADPRLKGKAYSKWMGALEDIDKFDPLFFSISPTEAKTMDPQQRLFLEESWKAIEDAGYNPKKLSDKRCGVFVGVSHGDYESNPEGSCENIDALTLMGNNSSILSARISYLLNLKGPCVSIDTACSSSLVAIAQACDSLLLDNCEMALAGGVCIDNSKTPHYDQQGRNAQS
ncbi:MAG: zinc-binding dehydrogenase [Sporocytophaga sp.]|nr:zinc-binding dehydrogenase [Sporocytophaga sp.]